MNLKIYKKTRMQGVYQHIKNKNYAIEVSKPYKTSISRIRGNKIYDKELVKDIVAHPEKYLNTPIDKDMIIEFKSMNKADMKEFDVLWYKYTNQCKFIEKLSYNTLKKKNIIYNKFLKDKIDKSLSKLDKEFWTDFILSQNTTDKQKNEILKQIKAFYSWLCDEDERTQRYNPVEKIKKLKVEKTEMKFWTPEETKCFLETVIADLDSSDRKKRLKAHLTYALTSVTLLCGGNRIGETRALFYDSFNSSENLVAINHSINYNRKDENFVIDTKTECSKRTNSITTRLIEIVFDYKKFLEIEYCISIDDHSLIFLNHSTNKPYTDDTLRKHFYYYCEKAKVPKIRMYDLRHTYATNLIAENIPVYYIQKSLGHSSYNTTVKNYVHAREDMKITTAEKADKLFQF